MNKKRMDIQCLLSSHIDDYSDDDREDTVRERLVVYHSQTEPLVAWYAKWAASGDPRAPRHRKIDGMGGVEAIRDACLAALTS